MKRTKERRRYVGCDERKGGTVFVLVSSSSVSSSSPQQVHIQIGIVSDVPIVGTYCEDVLKH